jgi:phosphatidate cytidylyltransferase
LTAMLEQANWQNPIYQKTALIVLGVIFVSGALVFWLRRKNYYFVTAWASIKSWLIAAPLMFLAFGAPHPWPLAVTSIFAIMGMKVYFQLVGMYHRSNFVMISYGGAVGLAFCAYYNRIDLYNLMPMFVLGVMCLVPLIRNSYNRMIQYISMSLLGFSFLGWAFMHLALILQFEHGIYQAMYLIILTEFCDNTNLALGRYIGKTKWISEINPKRTVESTLVSILATLGLSSLMRYLLPDSSESYWLLTGLIASLAGILGDLVMAVIRRDLGLRVLGPFILGRGDFLHRMDRLVFVAPIYYYAMTYLPAMRL